MAELQLTLTAEERDMLLEFLEQMLHDAKIEEHRTRTLSYREFVVERENLIAGLLSKLERLPK